jgi:hypothetical protein
LITTPLSLLEELLLPDVLAELDAEELALLEALELADEL